MKKDIHRGNFALTLLEMIQLKLFSQNFVQSGSNQKIDTLVNVILACLQLLTKANKVCNNNPSHFVTFAKLCC